MPLFMCQFGYTPESWAAQNKNPQNRIETVGRAAVEAAGGTFIGGWLCTGEYDAVFIADMPDIEKHGVNRLGRYSRRRREVNAHDCFDERNARR
jgi:uncharacterized protein with GYD domain